MNFLKGYINNNIEYFEKLSKWNNVLDKNSVEAGIYIEWQTQIYFEFMREFVPKEVQKYMMFRFIKLLKVYQKW